MSLEPPEDRVLAADDPAVNPGWELIEFLRELGADEFAVNFIYRGDAIEPCDRLIEKLAFAALGRRMRECTSTFDGQTNPRPVEVWRLDSSSLAALRGVMPWGVLGATSIRTGASWLGSRTFACTGVVT